MLAENANVGLAAVIEKRSLHINRPRCCDVSVRALKCLLIEYVFLLIEYVQIATEVTVKHAHMNKRNRIKV